MASRNKALDRLARAAESRGLRLLPFSFGALAIPDDTALDSWTPVGAALVSIVPAGDGKPASLEVQGGLYIPPLERIIRAHDVFWPTTWGASPMDDFSVERLSLVVERSPARLPPQNEAETEELTNAVVETVNRQQANATFDRVKDNLASAVHEDWRRFIGLGFQYVLIRHFVFSWRHQFVTPSQDELLRLIEPAGRVSTQYVSSFLNWWENTAADRRG
jgi:hypothetical protein